MKKTWAVVAAAVALSSLSALPAHAESHWASYWYGAEVGDESRKWWDGNTDATVGYLKFTDCDHKAKVGVYKYKLGPDERVAYGWTCDSKVVWGDTGKATYHFTLKAIDGADKLYTDYVYVKF